MDETENRVTGAWARPISRRRAIAGVGAVAAGAAVLSGRGEGRAEEPRHEEGRAFQPRAKSADADGKLYSEEYWDVPGEPGRDYTPVVTPNGWTLPFKVVSGVKVFHLVAEEVEHEFAPGLKAKCWGFNGGVHGPTIEAVEGDRIRIYVTNRLPAPHAVHWHGILLPNGMDGVAGLNQPTIRPGETFRYEFTLRQHGTHMYHSHHDEMTQMALGSLGLFIIHPRAAKVRPDRDFALLMSEWQIRVGTSRPNPNEMTDFNVFTFNAKAFPGTAPLVAKLGDKVRIRLVNIAAMDHHPIHLHGYQFPIVATDGGPIPESAWQMETSVLTAIGQSRTIEFVADEPGDWALHCHMTHHVMNQMGDEFPNMVGVDTKGLDEKARSLLPGYMTMGQDGMGDMAEHIESGHMPVPKNSIPMIGGAGPFDYITMGGLFTIFKVHPDLTSYDDPGWYKHPPGTVADQASKDALERDGVSGDGRGVPRAPEVARVSHRLAPAPRGQDRGGMKGMPGMSGGGHGGHGGHQGHGSK
jgi:FtsP/CotA-like multicopper oxidase with cupredoxin domain